MPHRTSGKHPYRETIKVLIDIKTLNKMLKNGVILEKEIPAIAPPQPLVRRPYTERGAPPRSLPDGLPEAVVAAAVAGCQC